MDIKYMLYDKDIPYDEEYNSEMEDRIINNIENRNFGINFDNNKNIYFQNNLAGRSINILSMLSIDENSNVLQLVGKYGNLTESILSKGANVTCVETVEKRAKANFKRNNSNKFKMICTSSIFELELSEKFDYIFIVNIIENISCFKNDSEVAKSIETLILRYSSLLNENGKLIICVDNKFGLRNFAGYTKSENEKAFSMFLPTSSKINNYLSKYDIINILKQIPNYNYKFYYLLPDYEATSVAYTDEYMPNENSSKLSYNIYYNKFNTILFNETEVIREIVKSGAFDIFANSYMIEISKNITNVKFASFNNFRKKEYRLATIMRDKYVEKKAISICAQKHVNNIIKNIDLLNELEITTLDKYNDNTIISELSNLSTLDYFLYTVAIKNGKEELINQIEQWYSYVKEKLIISKNIDENIFTKYKIEVSNNILSKMNFVENGFYDMIFENIFYDQNEKKYFVYDQEWYENNVPVEFIIYRAIQSLFFHNKKIEEIVSKEELFDYYGLNEYISIFDELENKIQEKIIDRDVVNYFESTYEAITSVEGLKDQINNVEFYKKIIEKQKSDYYNLEKEYNDVNNKLKLANDELQKIKSSKIWKVYNNLSRRK